MHVPQDLVDTLKTARNVLVLTGAGMSAESGVPTFRGAQTGLWAKYRPEDLATPQAFRRQPQVVWDWYEERRARARAVAPHAGHEALVWLQSRFEHFLLVTQNVDGLHQRAGSTGVVELHGNLMRSVCSVTGQPIEESWLRDMPGHPPASPHHPDGLARPGVVWFGESLPSGAIEAAMKGAANCDVCFSIGTSTLVQPAASLPFLALENGAVVVEINPEATSLSPVAHYSLRASAADALTGIVGQLSAGG